MTTSSLKGATLAALLVTAYDSLDADAQTAARTKITEGLGISSGDLDALMSGTTTPPDGAASVLAEALGLAEDDVNAAITADAATSSDDPAPSEPDATNMNETPPPAAPTTPAAPAPAAPAAPSGSEAANPAPSDAPAPTQKADDPTYVLDSAQKKKALMTLDEMVIRLGEIRNKIAALPEGLDGFYSLPLSVAPDVAGISHLAYALESFNPWEFCVLYKADATSQPPQAKDKNGKVVQPVRKSEANAAQPTVDLHHALTQAVARGSGPMAAIVRKSVADAVVAELSKFRAELQQDAPKSRPSAIPQIAPSVQLANESNHSVQPVLKNAQDVTAHARKLREEREKNKATR